MIGFVLLFAVVIPTLVSAPAYFLGRRKAIFEETDYYAVPVSGILWIILIEFGIGSQGSLSNVIEIPIVEIVVVFGFYARVFIGFRLNEARQVIAERCMIVFALVVPLIVRLVKPSLPE